MYNFVCRPTAAYREGVRNFVAVSLESLGNPSKIRCPCTRCRNLDYQTSDDVVTHLVMFGMDKTYDVWIFHGEERPSTSSKMTCDLDDISDTYRMFIDARVNEETIPNYTEAMGDEGFSKLLEVAETPLYTGCSDYTKLTATVVLFKLKVVNGISDKAFTELLKILGHMLPQKNVLPSSTYAAKRLLKTFDLGYEKIHACPNDCCLFRKDLVDLDNCPRCGKSRWKVVGKGDERKIKKGVPAKVLRYFPIIPRFRRMFRSLDNSEQLLWHSSHHSNDNKMRHPVDSPQWQSIDSKWPFFSSDPRNLRLGLATDGFNPYSNLSSTHSCWPVMLVNYNLPPWLCMKRENMMLTLVIPGPRQPGNDIDVYLRPLIEDLKELWISGVEVYDAFKKSMFNLRVILMWTINDFPAYGNLAGCMTKGKMACPICGANTSSIHLPHSHKCAYMGHRRFLISNHHYRKKKNWFDGTHEKRGKPHILSGSEILEVVNGIENDFGKWDEMSNDEEPRQGRAKGKRNKKRKRKIKKKKVKVLNWKKKSIFFELPYYEV